jgi:hypothetical protein
VADFRRKPKRIIVPKVMVIDFRPAAIPQSWNLTDDLVKQYAKTMREITDDVLVYRIVKRATVRNYPLLLDGRRYTDATWTQAIQDDRAALRDSHGNYMLADYVRIIQDFKLLALVRDKLIDEVWMFGGPYFGFYESRMVGKGAFWCNAPAIEQTGKRFIMMGFNYQRDLKEMVHDFGHRTESILCKQFDTQTYLNQLYGFQATSTPKNDFEQWLLDHGTVHRKPGGVDYGQDEIAWVKALKAEWLPPAVNPNLVK